MSNQLDDMINKSLEDIDAIVDTIAKSKATGGEDTISKAQDDEDLNAGEVSEDAPAEDNEPVEDNESDDEPTDEGGEDSGDVDSDDEGGEAPADEDEDMDKSLEDQLKSNDSVRKALEVSEFLDTLVKGISSHINASKDVLSKSVDATNQANEMLAKSFQGIAKSQRVVLETQAELVKSVRAISKRLKAIESQPVVRKSVADAKTIEKSFVQSAGSVQDTSNQLSKSQISGRLSAEIEKGNMSLTQDLLAFEAMGDVRVLSQAALDIINRK